MTEERAVNESLVKIVFWQLPVASGMVERNCSMIIQSLPASSLTFLLLPQMPREFLKVLDVTVSPWEMWKGERTSFLKMYFYIMS